MKSRRKIGLITSISNGVEVRTTKEQQMLDEHLQFIEWYKRWKSQTTLKAEIEVEITPSKPKRTFWNPILHHWAVVFGEKLLIKNEEEYKRYLELGFKILPQ